MTDPLDIFSTTVAEGCLFLVNQNNESRYISADGTTVVMASSSTGHLYNCPNANVINFYKDRLYVSDFTYGGVRNKTSVLRSSPPLGIIALVNDDYIAGAPFNLTVTDNKYIYTVGGANTLEVYRGSVKVATVTVSAIKEGSITLTGDPSYEPTYSTVLAADELWAPGTFSGAKQIRWVKNPTAGGINAKSYDTFRITGADNEEVKMMANVNNVMLIANNSSISVWNNFVLQSLEGNVGCVSRKGNVHALGNLYFIHWSGIYQTDGSPPKRISDKIQRYFDGATKSGLESSCAGTKGKSIFFSLGNVTLVRPDGSTEKILNNVVVEFNIVQNNWFVHVGVDAVDFETWVDEINPDRLVMSGGDSDTTVLEFLSGLTDNTREIPMRIDTPNIMLGVTFERISNPLEVVIESERGNGLKCFISLDMSPWYEIEGETVKGCTILKVTGIDEDKGKPPRCRNIRLSLRDNSRKVCKISKIAINYVISNELENARLDYV